MSKKYVNGYDKFRFKTVDSQGSSVTYDFSFRYQALKEYYERITTQHNFTDGSKEKKSHFVDYEWRLFYTDYIEKDDLLKLRDIENAEISSKKLFLTPHIDTPWRVFEVLVLDEKREIDLHLHHGGADDTPNKGYEISFGNAKRISEVNIIDPDVVPVVSAVVGEEFA